MSMQVCPKCKGRLICVTEFLPEGGEDLDVIKCQSCGNRIASRPHNRLDSTDIGRLDALAASIAPAPEPAKVITCKLCDREMPIVGQGYCGKCYYHQVQKPAGKKGSRLKPGRKRKLSGNQATPPCLSCSRPGLMLAGRGLCKACHAQHKKDGTLDQFPDRRVAVKQTVKPVIKKQRIKTRAVQPISIQITGVKLPAESLAALQRIVEIMASYQAPV